MVNRLEEVLVKVDEILELLKEVVFKLIRVVKDGVMVNEREGLNIGEIAEIMEDAIILKENNNKYTIHKVDENGSNEWIIQL